MAIGRAEQKMSSSSCLGRAAVPAKRVWRGLTARLGLRRATYVPMNRPEAEADMDVADVASEGLGGLRKDVRRCEYDDVHVMWDMLSNTTAGATGVALAEVAAAAAGKKATATRRARKPTAWSRLVYYCCAL